MLLEGPFPEPLRVTDHECAPGDQVVDAELPVEKGEVRGFGMMPP